MHVCILTTGGHLPPPCFCSTCACFVFLPEFVCVVCVCPCVRACVYTTGGGLFPVLLQNIAVHCSYAYLCVSSSHTYDRWLPSPTTEGAGRSGTAISGTRYATLSKAWTVLPEPLLLSCVGHPTSTPTQTQAKQNGGYLVCVRVRVRALCVAYPTSSGKNGV